MFDLSNLSANMRDAQLIYSIDNGENLYYDYSEGDTLIVNVAPGKHIFRFYGGVRYLETPHIQLEIEEQHRSLYLIHFQTYRNSTLRKPVIYLYPEVTTNVSVGIQPLGELTFTYPEIASGWHVTAHPNGILEHQENNYRYLFWEADQVVPEGIVDPTQGAIVSGNAATAYLEQQLTAFGMTAAERADFLTYWGPQMQTKTNLYIYLLFNEVCNTLASLEISPEPAEIARFYVIWTEVPENYNPHLEPQKVPTMNREGFTVLEWGGIEVEAESILSEEL